MRSVPGIGSSLKSPRIVGSVGLTQYTSSAVPIVSDAADAASLGLPSVLDMGVDRREGSRPPSAQIHTINGGSLHVARQFS